MKAIETERLVVRNFCPDDWIALHEIIRQYQATEYADYDHEWPSAPEELRRITEWFAGQDSFVAVCRRETGDVIGLVTIKPDDSGSRSCFNLGFIFDRRIQGRGYACEAGQAVLGLAFAEWGAEKVVSGTARANCRAVKLLERLGFDGVAESQVAFRNRPDGTPIVFAGVTYVLTREDWARHARG